MKEIIKTGFAWARYNRERIRWRPRNLQFDSLTASEKKQVDRLWGGYGQNRVTDGMSTIRVLMVNSMPDTFLAMCSISMSSPSYQI